MFWATLWGPIGLILSTPLTVCLVVLGRYVPQLQFLEIMLGSEPVLRPEERLYQRLVAGNTEEAIELAEEGEGEDPVGFYANVLIPALRLAEADLSANPADLQQRRQVVESLEGVVDELEQDVEIADAPPGCWSSAAGPSSMAPPLASWRAWCSARASRSRCCRRSRYAGRPSTSSIPTESRPSALSISATACAAMPGLRRGG